MTKSAETVLAEALQLDAEDRAELAAKLLASLDGPADPDVESAWAEEIARRVQAVQKGTVELESWENVVRRIQDDLDG